MFQKLIGNLVDLLDSKINPLSSMDRNEKLQDALENVREAGTFDELIEALRPVATCDRGIRTRFLDLEQCAAERLWLSGGSREYLKNWYASEAENIRGTRQIAHQVSDVKRALELFAADKKEPDMGRWTTKQRELWQVEVGK